MVVSKSMTLLVTTAVTMLHGSVQIVDFFYADRADVQCVATTYLNQHDTLEGDHGR